MRICWMTLVLCMSLALAMVACDAPSRDRIKLHRVVISTTSEVNFNVVPNVHPNRLTLQAAVANPDPATPERGFPVRVIMLDELLDVQPSELYYLPSKQTLDLWVSGQEAYRTDPISGSAEQAIVKLSLGEGSESHLLSAPLADGRAIEQVIPVGDGLVFLAKFSRGPVQDMYHFDGEKITSLDPPAEAVCLGWGFIGQQLELAVVDESGSFLLLDPSTLAFAVAPERGWMGEQVLERTRATSTKYPRRFIFGKSILGWKDKTEYKIYDKNGVSGIIQLCVPRITHSNGIPRHRKAKARILTDPLYLR